MVVGTIYDNRSSVIPSERPHNFSCCCFGASDKGLYSLFGANSFSRISLVRGGCVGYAGDGCGSRRIAGNSMLPTRSRTSTLSTVECLGASRDAASTVTFDHLG